MEIRLLDVAQQELDEAIEYYNDRSPGLGDQFLLEVANLHKRPGYWSDRIRQNG